jgi:hypothetical protein
MVTIGVPTKGTSLSLIRVLKYCHQLPRNYQILVSINPGYTDVEIPSTYLEAPNFKFIWQKDDLGLYGNFRFLLQNSETQLFCWFCVDDNVSGSLGDICEYAIDTHSDLTISCWQLDEYDLESAQYEGNARFGILPDLTNSYTRVLASLNIDPSWMFGVWKTSYLKEIFPKNDFDWLDCDILQEVLLKGKVSIFTSAKPALIGTHYKLNRQPNAVALRGHSPKTAIMKQLSRTPYYFRFGSLTMKLMFIRCWTLYNYSRRLNRVRRKETSGRNR